MKLNNVPFKLGDIDKVFNYTFKPWTDIGEVKYNGNSIYQGWISYINDDIVLQYNYLENNGLYYFITDYELVNIMGNKYTMKLKLELDIWFSFKDKFLNGLNGDIIAKRFTDKRYKKVGTKWYFNYSFDSNVWNIDSEFNNLQTMNYSSTILETKHSKKLLGVKPYAINFSIGSEGNRGFLSTNGNEILQIIYNNNVITTIDNTNKTGTINYHYENDDYLKDLELINRENLYVKINQVNNNQVDYVNNTLNCPYSFIFSNEQIIQDGKNFSHRIENIFKDIKFERSENLSSKVVINVKYSQALQNNRIPPIAISPSVNIKKAFDTLKEYAIWTPYNDFNMSLEGEEIYGQLYYLRLPAIIQNTTVLFKDIVLFCIAPEITKTPTVEVKDNEIKISGDKPLGFISNELQSIQIDNLSSLSFDTTTFKTNKVKEYELINKPIEIDITKLEYDYLYEPQIWMSHCYKNILKYNGNGYNIPAELGDFNKFYIFSKHTTTGRFDKLFISGTTELNNYMIKQDNSYTFDNTLPARCDSYEQYLLGNKNSLETSMYANEKNMEFTKRNNKHNTMSAIMNTVSSAAMGAAGGAMGGNPIMGIAGAAIGGAKGMFGLQGQLNQNEQSMFSAQLAKDKLQANQTDLYNSPDTLTSSNTDVFKRDVNSYMNKDWLVEDSENWYNFKIAQFLIKELPYITTLKEYSSYVNRFGYISNNQLTNFNLNSLKKHTYFDYWEIQDITLAYKPTSSLPLEIINSFRDMFNNGVRIWWKGFKDFDKQNWEVEIERERNERKK